MSQFIVVVPFCRTNSGMSLSTLSVLTFFVVASVHEYISFLISDISCLRNPPVKQNILCPAEYRTFSVPLQAKVCRNQSIQNRPAIVELLQPKSSEQNFLTDL